MIAKVVEANLLYLYEKGEDLFKKFKKIFENSYLKGTICAFNYLHNKPMDKKEADDY